MDLFEIITDRICDEVSGSKMSDPEILDLLDRLEVWIKESRESIKDNM